MESGRCVVIPGVLPAEPAMHAHLRQRRELRPGLHLHFEDAEDARDFTASTELTAGVRIVVLLDGGIDVSYGSRHVCLGASAGHAQAAMVSLTRPDEFTRRAQRGRYSRRLVLGLSDAWLAQLADEGLGAETASASLPPGHLAQFMRQHLALHQWTLSPRVTALAEQIVRPPPLAPMLQGLYQESRALELVCEAFGAVRPEGVRCDRGRHDLRPREHQRMRELQQFIDSGAADDMGLDAIARHVGINANSLQQKFRGACGTTVFDYVKESRIQRARRALEREGVSVGQAAMIAGYNSAANFATAFKRRFAITPRQARARV